MEKKLSAASLSWEVQVYWCTIFVFWFLLYNVYIDAKNHAHYDTKKLPYL